MALFMCAWNWWGVVLLLAAQHGVLISPAKTLNKSITASFSSFVPSSSSSSFSSSVPSSSFSVPSSSSSSFSSSVPSSSFSVPSSSSSSFSSFVPSSSFSVPSSSSSSFSSFVPSFSSFVPSTSSIFFSSSSSSSSSFSSPSLPPLSGRGQNTSTSMRLSSSQVFSFSTNSPPMNLHISQTPTPNTATLIKGLVTPSSPTSWPAHPATISAVSQSEMPSPHSVSGSLNSTSLLTTSVSPTTRPTGVTLTTNFKLILYIAPPLLVVVVVAIAISLCLCIKRYRRIRRYRLQLLPLHDMDGSDIDSEEDEEEREEENSSEREPAFTLQHQARPILAFEDSS